MFMNFMNGKLYSKKSNDNKKCKLCETDYFVLCYLFYILCITLFFISTAYHTLGLL